ncbi:rhomboid family intramembrane serine protease [Pontibacter sp. KCTC 32443]|uniref:rhomboid family intramembrane serine protease n=1 Tax=Pontibacter TaxID=323449 RepID=UPI00164E392B|nr:MULTISPECIES: rhomboid family intramembrane serine protease [Pontibacter]MBC5774555.1 rhomboid family intramembrane serine protease [Pontibacter sp. KCTC 32443]
MENRYTAEVAILGTEELLGLLQAREEYEPEIILAVIAELQIRQVQVPDLEELKEQTQAAYKNSLELENQSQSSSGKTSDMFQVFVPQRGYFVTPVLLNLNLLVFVVMLLLGLNFMNPEAGQLFAIGGNYGPYTLSGQWWRLFTSTFLHGGIIHLLLNMMALVSVGRQLEQMIGRTPFLVSYILCGLAGSLLSVWWDGTRVSVGASGAIFGMFGLLLLLMALERKLTWKEKKAMLGNLVLVIGINLGYGMKGGIDNAAHAGGLIAGSILGAVLMLRSNRVISANYSLVGTSAMAGAGLVLLSILYTVIPFTGQKRYLYTMDQVAQKEAVAMQTLQKLSEAGEEAKAAVFAPQLETGVKLWDESETLLEAIDDVEGTGKDRVLVMLDYVRLRKISFQMLHDDLKQNRPLLNPKQQQVLEAINDYATTLQQGKESEEIANRNQVIDVDMPEVILKGDESESPEGNLSNDYGQMKVLVVIDGIKVGYKTADEEPAQLAGLDETKIENITVLKGKQARDAYGEEGANGVIEITTKQ